MYAWKFSLHAFLFTSLLYSFLYGSFWALWYHIYQFPHSWTKGVLLTKSFCICILEVLPLFSSITFGISDSHWGLTSISSWLLYRMIDMYLMHSFPCGHPVFPASFIRDTVFSLPYIFGNFVKYQMALTKCTSIWVLYSVPPIYISDLVPKPWCLHYSSSVIQLEIWHGDLSFCSGMFLLPYEF